VVLSGFCKRGAIRRVRLVPCPCPLVNRQRLGLALTNLFIYSVCNMQAVFIKTSTCLAAESLTGG
jgi:hypothetical protein